MQISTFFAILKDCHIFYFLLLICYINKLYDSGRTFPPLTTECCGLDATAGAATAAVQKADEAPAATKETAPGAPGKAAKQAAAPGALPKV